MTDTREDFGPHSWEAECERRAGYDRMSHDKDYGPLPCRKCGGVMRPSQALIPTVTGSMKDFESDPAPVTFSLGGPGKLVDCKKCENCGWSVT